MEKGREENRIGCYMAVKNPTGPISEEGFLTIISGFLKSQGLGDPRQKDFWLEMIRLKKEEGLPKGFLKNDFVEIVLGEWPSWFKKMALFARLTPDKLNLNKLESEGFANGGMGESVHRFSGYDDSERLAFLLELDSELFNFSVELVYQLFNPLIAYMNSDSMGHLMRGYANLIMVLLKKADIREAELILSVFKNNLIGIAGSGSQYSYESQYYAFDSLMEELGIPNSYKELALRNLCLAIEQQKDSDVRSQAVDFYIQSLDKILNKNLLEFSMESLGFQLEFLEGNRKYLQVCPFDSERARIIIESCRKLSSDNTEYVRNFIVFLLKFEKFIFSSKDISFWEKISEDMTPQHVWERMGIGGENLSKKIAERIKVSVIKTKKAMDEGKKEEEREKERRIERDEYEKKRQQNLEDLQKKSWLLKV